MTLTTGVSIGPYEIVGPLGAGGMGEVYRARDARLNRDVALKVLPEVFALDSDRIARFKREAQMLAALNHPHIAAIYGLEESHGVQALVLELVEGPTLADHLRRGRIPMEEALPIARQIVEALEAAHEVGIIHRDLKPANVKLRPDGTVKVLDFGLAKLSETGEPGARATGAANALNSPTITSPAALTMGGMILGTAAYMSPEQAKGRPADRRSDVWAFGAVLFEMLSGQRPFRGDDVTDTLAAVLRADPAWSDLPSETPPSLHRLLRRCLQKDPRRRVQHVGDARLELVDIEQGAPEGQVMATGPKRMMPIAALALGVAALFTAIGISISRWLPDGGAAAAVIPVAFTVTLPAEEELAGGFPRRPIAISPDGTQIVYAAVRKDEQRLFLRALNKTDAIALAGTDNGSYPVFSPDGASIAFFADGWLKRVPITGGTGTTIAAAAAPRGLAWGSDDHIVFTPHASSGLLRVPASGGVPTPLTELDRDKGETNHRWPLVLPNATGVLYAVQGRSRTELKIVALSFQSGARTDVLGDGFPVQLLDTGHLVYSAVNGDIFAAPFDPSRLTVTGPAIPMPDRSAYTTVAGAASLALSPNGTMVTIPWEEPTRSLVLVGRDGASRTLPMPARNYTDVKVSPDGRRVAVVIQVGIAEWDIWTLDVAADMPLQRATVGRFSINPVWAPDSATLVYSAFEDGTWKILSRNVVRNEPPRELLAALPQEPIPLGKLPDGSLAYTLNLPQHILHLAKDRDPVRTIPPPATGQFSRQFHGLSPDGRWLAYQSNQSGQPESYITGLSNGDMNQQVSRNGGDHTVWAKTGRQLFYRRSLQGAPGEILSVTVNPDGTAGAATVVLTGDYVNERGTYDVFPDGSFLMFRNESPTVARQLEVVVNWTALRRLSPER